MLAVLAHDPGISQAELARRVMITPQSLSESLARLLGARLIARANSGAGRASRLVLTDAGRTLLAQAYPVVEAFDRACFESLTDGERTDLMRLLSKVLASGPRSSE